MKREIVCPNKHDPAWKTLVKAVGERRAFIAFFRNGNVIPDPATAWAKLGLKAPDKTANTRRRSERVMLKTKANEQMAVPKLFALGAALH